MVFGAVFLSRSIWAITPVCCIKAFSAGSPGAADCGGDLSHWAQFGVPGSAGRQLCGLEYEVTWVRVWVKTGKKVYFKLQIHNLEPAERFM